MAKERGRRRVRKSCILILLEIEIEGVIMNKGRQSQATSNKRKAVQSGGATTHAPLYPAFGDDLSGPMVRYDRMRVNKPLREITVEDYPSGFDPEDVASDFSEK